MSNYLFPQIRTSHAPLQPFLFPSLPFKNTLNMLILILIWPILKKNKLNHNNKKTQKPNKPEDLNLIIIFCSLWKLLLSNKWAKQRSCRASCCYQICGFQAHHVAWVCSQRVHLHPLFLAHPAVKSQSQPFLHLWPELSHADRQTLRKVNSLALSNRTVFH